MSFLESLFKSIKQMPKVIGELVPQQQPMEAPLGMSVSLPQGGFGEGDMPIFSPAKRMATAGLNAAPQMLGQTAPFNPNGGGLPQGAQSVPDYAANVPQPDMFNADPNATVPMNTENRPRFATQPTEAMMPPQMEDGVGAERSGVMNEDMARQQLIDAISAPIKKEKWWKDAGAKGAGIASNIINGAIAIRNNRPMPAQIPIEGFGRMKHDKAVGKAAEVYQPLATLGQQTRKRALEEGQIADVMAKPGDRDAERERKINKDQRDYAIKQGTLDWKKDDRDRYFELEDVKREAKEKNDSRTYELAVRKQSEIERANGVKEGFEKVKETGRTERANIMAGSRKEVAGINQAGASERAAKQIQAADAQTKQKLFINSLEKWKAANQFASPEDISAAEAKIKATVFGQ